MKSLIIIYFVIATINLYSQTWNPIDTTDISFSASENQKERIAIFSNHKGIHFLKALYSGTASPQVRYFRLKTTGELDTNISTSGILLDSYGDLPNLVGDENKLYAIYRKVDTIKVQRSTNGGANWALVTIKIFSNGNVNCNGIDAAFTASHGLHIVWSEKVGNKYESYYARFDDEDWVYFYNFTNTTEVDSGGFPSVTTSSLNDTDRIHVSVNTGTADFHSDNSGRSYSRGFDYTTWADPVAILPSGYVSRMDKLIVTGSYIHCFYYSTDAFPRLKYRKKLVTSLNWGNEIEIDDQVYISSETHKMSITKTPDDTLHVIWADVPYGIWYSKKHIESDTWSSPYQVNEGGSQFRDFAITSSSNDLFIMYTWQPINYRYRQYDAVPLAPQSLSVSNNQRDEAVLSWSANTEPDVVDSGKYNPRFVNRDFYLIQQMAN